MKIQSAQNIYSIKHERFPFTGEWQEIYGNPAVTGVWSIKGAQKHGKSTKALMLAKMLSEYKKVLYVSGEEGFSNDFQDTMNRVGILPAHGIGFLPYISIEDLNEKLKKRNSPQVIFIDNMTVYISEFKRDGINKFIKEWQHKKLLIFISHSKRNEPATAAGVYVEKMANRIIDVVGLVATVGGRTTGGKFIINDEKADQFGFIIEKH